jgi:hypothetical protein
VLALVDDASVRRTLRISCEAVPPSNWPAGAQGGTSVRRSGAALSFVSCIRLLGGLVAVSNHVHELLVEEERVWSKMF